MKCCYNVGMGSDGSIVPPAGRHDIKGAQRTFEEFGILYRNDLTRIEAHLDRIIESAPTVFAEGYKPWRNALHDLLAGTYMMARNIPLPNVEGFMEALRMFSFDSSIHFLRDLCISCHIDVRTDWAKRFREHIDMLLFAFAVLHRPSPSLSR